LLLGERFVPGRFVLGSSFLGVMLVACWAFYSKAFCSWLLVLGYCACYLLRVLFQGVLFLGVLFLDPRSWILYLVLGGRFISRGFVPGSSFLDVMLVAY
jgi:hypothetical protein